MIEDRQWKNLKTVQSLKFRIENDWLSESVNYKEHNTSKLNCLLLCLISFIHFSSSYLYLETFFVHLSFIQLLAVTFLIIHRRYFFSSFLIDMCICLIAIISDFFLHIYNFKSFFTLYIFMQPFYQSLSACMLHYTPTLRLFSFALAVSFLNSP